MKKLHQKGFSLVEGLLIVVLIGLIAGVGFYVYRQSQDNNSSKSDTPRTAQEDSQKKNPNITELDPAIELTKPSDVEKLPDSTPDSFIAYLEKELSKPPEDGCIEMISISKVSELNLSGSVGSANAETLEPSEGCFGGASATWYLQGDKWQLLAMQAPISCDELAKMKIYEEFLETCVEDFEAEDINAIPNPNGPYPSS